MMCMFLVILHVLPGNIVSPDCWLLAYIMLVGFIVVLGLYAFSDSAGLQGFPIEDHTPNIAVSGSVHALIIMLLPSNTCV